MKNYVKILLAAVMFAAGMISHANAESALDKIVQSKKLRCGTMLDDPPAGFRDQNNQPDGYDVTYCKDMAKALGAEVEIVETPSPDRIPALVSNRIDVLISSTTPTASRALTVGFTQPYTNNIMVVVTRKETGITQYSDLKSKKLGSVVGATPEQLFKQELAGGWQKTGATYTGYASDAESYLALQQGKLDAIVISAGVFHALEQSGQFPEFIQAGVAPLADFGSIAVHRDDQQFLNWARVFIFQQETSGRRAEVYKKYYGDGPLPSLNSNGVSF
ncbi:transporter substrate-binding domain-containing protein [Rhizobium hainanense]|uniref:Polar amino acid transport system substrate-binding protein n=1 Tax=Rhizobium hainanense TaxID=52131 RepID=A0A1C3VID9_9HYPH|nr:transporter substrate-binding domain-containing protein [Rhizobium hainanense]SCB27395.1 polar amino acid transport system substrate-binding protein [Rhizobium hainanense]